jgi:radical SAM-linked protein
MLSLHHRLRFEKAGLLRFISHLDLNRTVERLCRRAEVPFAMTGGFHPTPKIVFALSLSLGTVGRNEVMEIETQQEFDSDDLRHQLNAFAPDGLTFKNGVSIGAGVRGFPRRATYILPIESDQVDAAKSSIQTILSQDQVWAARLKPCPRQVNIKPYLRRIEVIDSAVHFDLWVTQSGTARTDELIALLKLPDPLDTGAVIERTDIELHDETPRGQPDAPPDGPPDLRPYEHSAGTVPAATELPTAMATWGLSPNGPEVE